MTSNKYLAQASFNNMKSDNQRRDTQMTARVAITSRETQKRSDKSFELTKNKAKRFFLYQPEEDKTVKS